MGLLLLDLAHHGLVARFDDWAFAKMPHQPDNRFWNLVAWVGEPWAVVVYVLILTVALLVIHEEQAAAWVLWTLGIGNVLGIITKKTLKRERPGPIWNMMMVIPFPAVTYWGNDPVPDGRGTMADLAGDRDRGRGLAIGS